MIRCIAIDDEPKALEIIERHAARCPMVSLEATFLDPARAVAHVAHHPVDLVFLDIQMPAIDGMRLVDQLVPRPMIVFTTAHSEYALQSYEVEAVDYLLKPFDYPRFFLAVSRAAERLPAASRDLMFVNTGTQRQRIVLSELVYVEGEGNYVQYVTRSGKHLVRSSMKETIQSLPTRQFVQVHRSYLVAFRWIEKVEDHHVYMTGNTILPVGATYRAAFARRLDTHRG